MPPLELQPLEVLLQLLPRPYQPSSVSPSARQPWLMLPPEVAPPPLGRIPAAMPLLHLPPIDALMRLVPSASTETAATHVAPIEPPDDLVETDDSDDELLPEQLAGIELVEELGSMRLAHRRGPSASTETAATDVAPIESADDELLPEELAQIELLERLSGMRDLSLVG